MYGLYNATLCAGFCMSNPTAFSGYGTIILYCPLSGKCNMCVMSGVIRIGSPGVRRCSIFVCCTLRKKFASSLSGCGHCCWNVPTSVQFPSIVFTRCSGFPVVF